MDKCLQSEVTTKTLLSPEIRLSKAWVNTTPCHSSKWEGWVVRLTKALTGGHRVRSRGGLVAPIMLDMASATGWGSLK